MHSKELSVLLWFTLRRCQNFGLHIVEDGGAVNDEMERTWKKTVVVYSK
jgi:hypothetical protein